MNSSWRETARPIIYKIISQYGVKDKKLLRAKLRKAYPFGEKAYHPYKIWLDEIKKQINTVERMTGQIGLFKK